MKLTKQNLRDLIKESLDEKSNLSKMKKRNLPPQYGASKGSKRRKALDKAAAAYADGDVKKAAKIADAENAKQRKKGIPQTKRHDTGKYTESVDKDQMRILINDIIAEQLLDEALEEYQSRLDEKRKKRKKRKKSKSRKKKSKKGKKGRSASGLSAAVKKSLNKKADNRCLTRGSVYSEFRKGLAAYLSSGSRRGMTAHQWAHARVNSANPSKSWATVKKRKTCPKKKKGKK